MKIIAYPAVMQTVKRFFAGWLLLGIPIYAVCLLHPPEASPELPDTTEITVSEPEASADISPEQTPVSVSETDTSELQSLTAKPEEESDTPKLVYYNQKDDAWKDISYGSDSIGGYGCGPTACAIILSTLTENTVTPADMAEWSVQNGCYVNGGGSYHILIPLACKSFGLSVTGCTANDREEILAALSEGALVGVIMGPGHFTESGHFIVLYGINEAGEVLVADPASYENSKISWDPDIIFDEAKSYASGGGPFWIIRK